MNRYHRLSLICVGVSFCALLIAIGNTVSSSVHTFTKVFVGIAALVCVCMYARVLSSFYKYYQNKRRREQWLAKINQKLDELERKRFPEG